MSTFTDSNTLHPAPVVCDGCNSVRAGIVTASGRIVSVDAATARHRGGIFHRDCHGKFVLEQEVDADGAT